MLRDDCYILLKCQMEEEISSRPIAVQLKSAQKVWNTLETLWKYPSSETGYGYE